MNLDNRTISMRPWKNGTHYTITGQASARDLFRVPVTDVLDYYMDQHIKGNLSNSIHAMKDPILVELAASVLEEREPNRKIVSADFVLQGSYNGPRKAKIEKTYDASKTSDASLIATALGGKEDKLQSALSEIKARGISFTVKQVKAAAAKGRDLTLAN